jgi:spore germination cell wall hydrolase CwlJ-like protein
MLGTALALILATSSPVHIEQPPTTPTQIECLARNIYFESRNQGYRGMQAVANVTMNRVNSEK